MKLVSDGIKEAADGGRPGALFCDSEIDAAKALACAQNFKVQGAQGVINFQVFQDSSPEICAAYDSVPTIAIDIIQPPCQIAFMGANNHEAGRMADAEIGKYAKDNWDCEYTAYVSLESTAAGAANTDRMGGWRDGFQESCPITSDKERILDGADRTDPALDQMTDLLGSLPGDRIIVVAINEDGILGAIGAANTLGRRRTCSTPARAPTRRSGRTSPAIRSTSCRWPTSPSATGRCHPEHGEGAPGRDDPRRDLHRSTRSSTRTTSGRSTPKRPPAGRHGVGRSHWGDRMTFALRAQGSASRSVASRSSMAWTSTPPVVPCSRCSARTAPASSTLVKIIAGDYTADDGRDHRRRARRTASLTPIAGPATSAWRSSSRSSRTRRR